MNSGLFVGVNTFQNNAGLPGLRFAVDDAVALAHAFAVRSDLISPSNTCLCLAGDPASETARSQLAELRRLGAHLRGANKPDIVDGLEFLQKIEGGEDAMVVVAFSTHGIELATEPCLLPADYRPKAPELVIRLSQIRQCLIELQAGQKVLIVDACREQPTTTQRGVGGMREAWTKGLSVSGSSVRSLSGLVELRSCSTGQVSHENDSLGQGVFTHFVLEGLAGKAPADEDGRICMGRLAIFVREQTEKWVRTELNREQTPSWSGERNWEKIALARVRSGVAEERFTLFVDGWTNRLGMEFQPLFSDAPQGRRLLFSRHETRVRDFDSFVTQSGMTNLTQWRRRGFPQTSEDPVVRVNLAEAQAFCQWLTQEDRRAQRLGQREGYRLPTVEEWRSALLAGLENAPPLAGDLFVWGLSWPPTNGSGNFGGAERAVNFSSLATIPGFRDRHLYTAPVGSCSANKLGLYDMAGNVWEWCAGFSGKSFVVGARGGAYSTTEREKLRAAFLYDIPSGMRQEDVGFRCVLDIGGYRHPVSVAKAAY